LAIIGNQKAAYFVLYQDGDGTGDGGIFTEPVDTPTHGIGDNLPA
jgi:hypothetical protein